MNKLILSGSILAIIGFTAGAQAAEPGAWTPAGPWQLDEQVDQCTLLRRFALGEKQLLMQVQPNLYSMTHEFKLMGDAVSGGATNGYVEFGLGPESKAEKLYGTIEATPDGRRVLRWTTDRTLPLADVVAANQTVLIEAPGADMDVTMSWQGAKKAFAALRDCQDRVATGKGEDAPARRAYQRELEPLGNPGRWVTNDDYPPKARQDRLEGITGFRLAVDESGSMTHCEIISSSGFPILDDRTCELLRKRARFAPPLDGHGAPVASTWSNRVRWQLPAGE